jgi:hypothetical protein
MGFVDIMLAAIKEIFEKSWRTKKGISFGFARVRMRVLNFCKIGYN